MGSADELKAIVEEGSGNIIRLEACEMGCIYG